MGYQKWSYELLHGFCMDAFEKFGFTEAEANIIQDVLLTADLYGIESHGMQRMVRYHKCIEKGMIHVDAKPEVVFETPVSAVVDGHDGMGQLIGHFAMELAIEKAKKSGVGIVSARNSNHFGIAGYYANMACKEGLIGFSCTNSEAIMVPTFGRKAMIGSNPIACAMPAEPYNFFFDASTTVVTRGKLEMYNKAEKRRRYHAAWRQHGKARQPQGLRLRHAVRDFLVDSLHGRHVQLLHDRRAREYLPRLHGNQPGVLRRSKITCRPSSRSCARARRQTGRSGFIRTERRKSRL